MPHNRSSQSALEYLMTYGWAILIIVIVAGVLYSLGIFNPSSSTGTTVTGFSGLGVTAATCVNSVNNQILELYVSNNVGYMVNVTKINVTGSNNGISLSQNVSSLLGAGQSGIFYVNSACNKSSSSYSGSATITYTEPGQTFSGPYLSKGAVSNVVSNPNSNLVGNFNGQQYTQSTHSQVYVATPSDLPLGPKGVTITVVAWVKPKVQNGAQDHAGILAYGNNLNVWCNGSVVTYSLGASGDAYYDGWCNAFAPSLVVPALNQWNFIAMVLAPGDIKLYNGTSTKCSLAYQAGSRWSNVSSAGSLYLGFMVGRESINGSMAGVQVYNTALTQSQLQTLCNAGIGAAPLAGKGLVGWWPLNGNALDFSGNGNNGVASNVQWISP